MAAGSPSQGPSFLRGWSLGIALIGYFLPAVVGVFVRAYLQRIGKPVIEWSWMFEPVRLVQFLVFFAYWDVPFLLVAALACRKPLSDHANRPLVLGAFLGTLASSTLVFADLWRNMEAILMGAVLIPFFILPGTLAGLALGWLLGRFLPWHTAAR
ncbi:MAG: hypothetical protein ACRD4Y_17180 [Candidatus Acidiferrales bacterium]